MRRLGILSLVATRALSLPLCVVQNYSPQWAPSQGNGTVVAQVSECPATESGIWCSFDGLVLKERFSFLAEIINTTHIACRTPQVDIVGRTRFGVSSSADVEPIEWFGFRFDPLVPNTYELIRELYEQEQIYQAKLKWPTFPPGTDIDDVKNASVPILVSASRRTSLIEGGPNVVLTVRNIQFEKPYECVWKSAADWQVVVQISARPYFPNQIICGITPAVSAPVHAVLLLYMQTRPVRGAGIPFDFVANAPREWTPHPCSEPDGMCSVPNMLRTTASDFVEEKLN